MRDSMPQSLPILEAIYGKLFFNNSNKYNHSNIMERYSPENVVWQIVKFFAGLAPNSTFPFLW